MYGEEDAFNSTNPSWRFYMDDKFDGANIAFYDGHVAWHEMNEMEHVGLLTGKGSATYGSAEAWSVMPPE